MNELKQVQSFQKMIAVGRNVDLNEWESLNTRTACMVLKHKQWKLGLI